MIQPTSSSPILPSSLMSTSGPRVTSVPNFRNIFEQSSPSVQVARRELDQLARTNLVPAKLGQGSAEITQINDRYKFIAARIGSLYKAVVYSDTVTEHDVTQIQSLREGLAAIRAGLPTMSQVEKKQAKVHILAAEKELDRLEQLGRLLPDYRKAECELDALILDVTSNEEGTFFSFDTASELLQKYAHLSAGIDETHPLYPILEHKKRELDDVFDEWAYDLVRDTEDEIELLLSVHNNDPQNSAALSLLVSLENQLDVAIDKLYDFALQAKEIGLYDAADGLRDSWKELEKVHHRLVRSLPEKDLPAPVHGSPEWRALREGIRPPPLERGLVGQFLHPEEWSETTKDRVFRLMAGMQLFSKGVGFVQELANHEERVAFADAMQREALAAVPPEALGRIDKEASMLARFLVEKYAVLNHPATLQALTKKHPEIRPALETAIKHFGLQAPGTDGVRSITEAYRLQRCMEESPKADPTRFKSFDAWWEALTVEDEPSKPQEIKLLSAEPLPTASAVSSVGESALERFGKWMGVVQESSPVLREQCAVKQTEVIQTIQRGRALHDAIVLSEKPNLEPMRELVTLSLGALMKSARRVARDDLSLTELADAIQMADDQCFAIEELEKLVAKEMETVRDTVRGDITALEAGGKKHTNIVLQHRVVEALNISGVDVPIPVALENQQVHAFLHAKAPEVYTHWQALDQLYQRFQGPGLFFQTEAAQEHTKAIDKAIERAFSADDAYDSLHLSPEMTELIERTRKAGGYFMVRSTGAEDTREAAVAGGNVSTAYVSADKREICQAWGETVRSYFGPKSLQIRMNSGEPLFEQELKLAVTVQPLIGEPVGGALDPKDIPVSLVLFSNEPLYIGSEQWRLMRISASFGHGEGVVGNMGIASDTYLLMVSEEDPEKLYIIRDVKDKPERLAPVMGTDGKVSLQKMSNPPELRTQPALTDAELARLYHYGVIGEKFFQDRGTDMEIVVKRSKIYPVQARPVNRPEMLPTYLNMHKIEAEPVSPVKQTLHADLLVVGKASVVEITRSDQILTAATLEEAEKRYDKNVHKLVVVHKDEPSNSHPVVNFSNLGMPCLVAKDAAAVKALIAKISVERPLAVCVQTGAMHLWDSSRGAISDYVAKGFGVHPAKIAQSLPTPISGSSRTPKREIPEEVKGLLIAVRSATTQEAAQRALTDLQQTPWVAAIRRRATFAATALASDEPMPLEVRERFAAIANFGKKWNKAIAEAEATLVNMSEGERLRPLFRAKVIESLLVGRADKEGSLGQFSAVDILAIDRDIEQLATYQSALAHPAHLIDLVLLGNKGVTDKASSEWIAFLSRLEPLVESGAIPKEKVQQFKALMNTLEQTRALSPWLTFFFAQALRETSPQELLDQLLQSLPASDNTFVQQQQERIKELKTLAHQIDRFADPKTFEAAWKTLLEHASPNAQKVFGDYMQHKASPMAQLIATGAMWELVDTFDRAIKAMLASAQWDQEDKVPTLKKMLKEYLELLKSWHEGLIEQGAIITGPQSVEAYLDLLEDVFLRLPDRGQEQLSSIATYSVDAALVNSQTAFVMHSPPNLEALFSVIHQNLIVCHSHIINTLVTKELIEISLLPDLIIDAVSQVASRYSMRTGVYVDESQTTFNFNVPLRLHSAKLTVDYDRTTESTTVNAQFFGVSFKGRWESIALFGLILDRLGIARLAEPMLVEKFELSVNWILDDPTQLPSLLQAFGEMCEMTIHRSDMTFHHSLLDAVDQMVQTRSMSESMVNSVIEDVLRISVTDGTSSLSYAAVAFARQLVQKGEGFQIVTELAMEAVKDSNESARSNGLGLFSVLVDNGQAFDLAIEAATKAVKDSNEGVRCSGLELFSALVEKGQAFDLVMEAATQAVEDRNDGVRTNGLRLFSALVEKGQAFERAIAAAAKAVEDDNDGVKMSGLELFNALVGKDQGFEEATAAATQAVKNDDTKFKMTGLKLFSALVEKDQGFEEATAAATVAVKNGDKNLQMTGLELFSALVQKDQGFQAAIAAATEALRESDIPIKWAGLTLFMKLVSKNQGFEAAIAAAMEARRDGSYDAVEAADSLFNQLFNRPQSFEAVIAAATEAMKDSDEDVRSDGHYIFTALMRTGRGFEAAIAAATEAIMDRDEGIRRGGERLFSALIDRGQGFEAAMAAATEAMKNSDEGVRRNGQRLLSTLVERNRSSESAITTAMKTIQDGYEGVMRGAQNLYDRFFGKG